MPCTHENKQNKIANKQTKERRKEGTEEGWTTKHASEFMNEEKPTTTQKTKKSQRLWSPVSVVHAILNFGVDACKCKTKVEPAFTDNNTTNQKMW